MDRATRQPADSTPNPPLADHTRQPSLRRALPIGSLLAALLVALWLPTGPLMAAAMITAEAATLRAALPNAASQPNAAATRHAELRRLKRLSAALLHAIRASSSTPDHDPASSHPSWQHPPTSDFIATEHHLLNPRAAAQPTSPPSTNHALNGITGGTRAAQRAGLIATPPPARA